ncbi:sigma-70 family RNA polymerase sigma factor [Amycolatopsis taiwanensis]|uniref:sigma-70 family RNA polymerase sigma factor n=1 Tax=Amycolatopsis taiwanensis TaxID=342230 RepID=UPI00047F35DE|nr:sigma-70 family RNA polymerase sigma factor [Amycolatopsis taiwanensis]
MVSVVDFEAARPQLTAVAFRLLGSIHDAEDVVQTTWLRAAAADPGDVRNSAAWLTTVLTRVCLDQLRARRRRREDPLLAEEIPDADLAADEHYLRRENVSRALMVVLDRLPPAQRAAYVLHDLFDVPFKEIAQTLNTSVANAKKHASRARQRIEQTGPNTIGASATVDRAVVEAFLAAAGGGDLDRMVALMTDDCVRHADPALLPADAPSVVTGARTIAHETTRFADRIRASAPVIVDNRPAHVIAPGGHLLAVVDIDTRRQLVSRITITRASAQTVVALPVTNV